MRVRGDASGKSGGKVEVCYCCSADLAYLVYVAAPVAKFTPVDTPDGT
jgi:hypothetical protein